MKVRALSGLNYQGQHIPAGAVFVADAAAIPDLYASGRCRAAADDAEVTWPEPAEKPAKPGK